MTSNKSKPKNLKKLTKAQLIKFTLGLSLKRFTYYKNSNDSGFLVTNGTSVYEYVDFACTELECVGTLR